MRAASVKHVECECDGGVRAPEELDGPALFGRFHVCRCDACQKYSDDEAACRALGYRGDVWVDGVGASVPIEFLLAEVKRLRGLLEHIQSDMGWTVQVWQNENYMGRQDWMEQICEIYADLAKGVEAQYHGDEEE